MPQGSLTWGRMGVSTLPEASGVHPFEVDRAARFRRASQTSPGGAAVGAIAVPRSLSSVERNGCAADGAVDCVCLRPRIFERGTEDGGKLNVGSSQVSMNLWRYEEV
jgi:hypothetical protein